jgi:4-amino-4-deoxy-L-arabinose transferase-like glycosyltransferase
MVRLPAYTRPAMAGAVLTFLFVALCCVFGARLTQIVHAALDPAERLAVGGLLGLGCAGIAALLVGLVPGALPVGLYVVAGLAVLGAWWGRGAVEWRLKVPGGPWLLAPLALAGLAALPLVAALAPSDPRDWDSLAYHLAVPKLWLEAGQVTYVPGIHQSNFPFTADMLFLFGLAWGGEPGAKAFSVGWLVVGCLAVFGLARRWSGQAAGWWAAIAFAGVPVVLWESGTAYIDVPHGLAAGLGLLYAAEAAASDEPKAFWLAGLCLGLGAATKHTGLQAVLAVGLVVLLAGAVAKRPGLKPAFLIGALAVAVALPWYAKSAAMTGNPVFPFFSSVFPTRDWDAWRASVYSGEQATFGVGRAPTSIGHAVLGLAYQPGRYVNPMQTEGGGFPTGAIGFAGLVAAALWCASGRAGRRERLVLAGLGLLLLAWFLLTQQSRYLTMVAVPMAVLLGIGVSRLALGRLLAVAATLQAGYTAWLLGTGQTGAQWLVVSGQVSADDYRAATNPFFVPAQEVSAMEAVGRVALYDEVFGYALDVPYLWANPGHPTPLRHDRDQTPAGLVGQFRALGITHIYVNLAYQPPEERADWLARAKPSSRAIIDPARADDPNLHWRELIAVASADGLIQPVRAWDDPARPRSVLFAVGR